MSTGANSIRREAGKKGWASTEVSYLESAVAEEKKVSVIVDILCFGSCIKLLTDYKTERTVYYVVKGSSFLDRIFIALLRKGDGHSCRLNTKYRRKACILLF